HTCPAVFRFHLHLCKSDCFRAPWVRAVACWSRGPGLHKASVLTRLLKLQCRRSAMNRLALLICLAFASIGVAADSPADGKAIIDRAVQARGGADKLAQFNRMSWTDNGTFYGMGNAMPYTATYVAEWPGKYRMEIKDFFTTILNGDKGWGIRADSTDELDKDQLAQSQQPVYAPFVANLLPLASAK